ncbi:acid phosphatase-domain-containing protein [Myxozyma melibiosi]|uniref:Acid phosphatase-domain-containing protein n=1 Tax=Myxozyma melibiosi TaxID=54550 RepID=A0ABR1FB24_9ASCO
MTTSTSSHDDVFGDGPLPKIVVFDLDYTLWLVSGERISFFKDVPSIISALKARGIKIGAASRTDAVQTAKKMLSLLHIDDKPAIESFDVLQIYPGSKVTHFSYIKEDTKIPYHEMIFFDDESRNKEVEHELGVKFVYVSQGVNWQLLKSGIEEWRVHQQEYASGAKKARRAARL